MLSLHKHKEIKMTRTPSIIIRFRMIPTILVSSLFSQSEQDLSLTKKNEQKLIYGKIISSVEQLPDSKTHKCQTMGIVYYPIEKIWEALGKYNHYNDFMPRTTVAFLINPDAISKFENLEITDWEQFEKDIENYKIDHFGTNPFYFYKRLNIPWPYRDRHYILKMERNDKEYFIHWIEIIGNSKENRGSWKLVPFKGNNRKTLAIYTLFIDPGIRISSKISKLGTKIALPGTIKALRKHLLKEFLKEKRKKKKS